MDSSIARSSSAPSLARSSSLCTMPSSNVRQRIHSTVCALPAASRQDSNSEQASLALPLELAQRKGAVQGSSRKSSAPQGYRCKNNRIHNGWSARECREGYTLRRPCESLTTAGPHASDVADKVKLLSERSDSVPSCQGCGQPRTAAAHRDQDAENSYKTYAMALKQRRMGGMIGHSGSITHASKQGKLHRTFL